MLVREDTRRKCGQTVVVESECERDEEKGMIMEWEWRKVREERPVKMEEGREDRPLKSRYEEIQE